MDTNTQPTPVPQAPGPAGEAPGPASEAPGASIRSTPRGRDRLPIALALAALVAVGGVGFAGGRLTAPQAAAVTGLPQGAGLPGGGRNPGGGGNGQGPGQGNAFGNLGRALGSGVAIRGTVSAVAADHVSLRLDSGQTIDIPIDAGTTYHRQASAASTDLATGTTVLVQLGAGAAGGAGSAAPNASSPPNAVPGGIGRFIGTARDITIVAQ